MIKIGNIILPDFPLLLAPMEDVSDPPFRYVCKQYGADMMYTEFISSEGLIRDAAKSIQKLDIFEYERPIGIQLFGGDVDHMREAAMIAEQARPDLIDINYGCPVKAVACKGAGAALLQDIPKMVKMTESVVKAVNLPVTVKTRLGWDEQTRNIVDVAERLQDIGIAALSIHGRTRKQMYKGPADWTLIGEVKNNPRIHIPVFGNGDVDSPEKAWMMKDRYGVDGVMIGRASIGNPWIFREIKDYFETQKRGNGESEKVRRGEGEKRGNGEIIDLPVHWFADSNFHRTPTISERVEVCRIHLKKSIEWKGDKLGVFEMRKHYSNYFKGVDHFREFRLKLVTAGSFEEINEVLNDVLLSRSMKMNPEIQEEALIQYA